MSLNKRCSPDVPATLPNGTPNPFHCPKSPRCDHFWHYNFRVNRQRFRASTETADKHKARDIEATERTRILEGKHGIRRQPDITFKAFAKTYIDEYCVPNLRPGTVSTARSVVKRLNDTFGNQLLREITSFGIEQFKSKLVALGLKPGTVNQQIARLNAVLNKAVEWKRLRESPGRVRKLKDRATRTRILTPDEQQRVVAACGTPQLQHIQPIIELLLITGARITELLNVRREDCEGGYLRFAHTKNGHPRRVPITPRMAEILASVQGPRLPLPEGAPHRARVYRLPAQRTGYLFTFFGNTRQKTIGSARKGAFGAALAGAGITTGDVTVHTLRHTALSRMMGAGIDARTIMEISGHRSFTMLQRYTHPTEQRKMDALSVPADGHNLATIDRPALEIAQ